MWHDGGLMRAEYHACSDGPGVPPETAIQRRPRTPIYPLHGSLQTNVTTGILKDSG